MRIVIRNLSQLALCNLQEELDPNQHWSEDYTLSDSEFSLYDVTISEYAQIKTHFDSVTIDCGGHLSSIMEDDFERIEII